MHMALIGDCSVPIAQQLSESGAQEMLSVCKCFYQAALPVFNLYRIKILEDLGSTLLESEWELTDELKERCLAFREQAKNARKLVDKLEFMRESVRVLYENSIKSLSFQAKKYPILADLPLLERMFPKEVVPSLHFNGMPNVGFSKNFMHACLSLMASNGIQIKTLFLKIDAPCFDEETILKALKESKSLSSACLAFDVWTPEFVTSIYSCMQKNEKLQEITLQSPDYYVTDALEILSEISPEASAGLQIHRRGFGDYKISRTAGDCECNILLNEFLSPWL